LHAPPAAAAAAATAAAATWLTTATIANQIKQLSCYEQKRGRLQPHQVARLTNKRELGVNPGIQRSMKAWCISSLPIKIYKNSSHLVLAKTLALAKRQRRCIGVWTLGPGFPSSAGISALNMNYCQNAGMHWRCLDKIKRGESEELNSAKLNWKR